MFNPFHKKTAVHFFSDAQQDEIVSAIKNAELQTSGEVRVFIENKCRFMDALDRAKEIFLSLKMDKTELRNGVLVYVALKDKQLAIYGDVGIYEKVSAQFWSDTLLSASSQFAHQNFVTGIRLAVLSIGTKLSDLFPYNAAIDKNELPDEIVFGDN